MILYSFITKIYVKSCLLGLDKIARWFIMNHIEKQTPWNFRRR